MIESKSIALPLGYTPILFGGFGEIRTLDQEIKSLLLYRLSYKPIVQLLVPKVGLEPTLLAELDFESSASTNFTTQARFEGEPLSLLLRGRAHNALGFALLQLGSPSRVRTYDH